MNGLEGIEKGARGAVRSSHRRCQHAENGRFLVSPAVEEKRLRRSHAARACHHAPKPKARTCKRPRTAGANFYLVKPVSESDVRAYAAVLMGVRRLNSLHEQFISEARKLVARASDELIGLEREGVTDARIDHVFRAFHTLKGSAGMVDLPAMTLTMHAAEDLIAEVQNGRVAATADLITQTLQCLDLVSRWIDAFNSTGELPSRADEEARTMVEQLRGHLAPKGFNGRSE